MSKKKKGSWVVRVKATVIKEVICEDCTKDEAVAIPFDYAESEMEVEQVDWEVVDVKPNE